MTQEPVTTRREHLYSIAAFCEALDEALRQAGLGSDESLQTFRAAVSAECVACGIQVSGEELYALSQPPAPERATAKIGRLRLGDCARKGCDTCYYRISFKHLPHLDWPKLLSCVDTPRQQTPTRPPIVISPKPAWRVSAHSGVALRVVVALGVIALLLLVRQWHQGGRIPFFREPENFRIDTAMEEVAPGPD